jgi:hypothetical protein
MIVKAVERAYRVMAERGYDTVYWAVDLHGVCLASNYASGGYQWLNGDVPRVLKLLSDRPENKIILWSSVYPEEKSDIIGFFRHHGIEVWDFNGNDSEPNTKVSCFNEKFYFSVLLDDKAGFDPDTDWKAIEQFYLNH